MTLLCSPGLPDGSGARRQAPALTQRLGGQAASAEGRSVWAPTPRDVKGHLEESRAGELATCLREDLKAVQLAGELAQREVHSALDLVRATGSGSVSPWGPRLPRCLHSAQRPAATREEPGPGGVTGRAGDAGEGPE